MERRLGDVLMVTLFAWIAHRLQSSKRCTRKSSVASCSAITPSAVQRKGFCVRSLLISRTCMSKANRSNALSTKRSSCRLMQTLWRPRHHAITGHATPLETTKATGCSHGHFHDLGPLLALTVRNKKGLFGARAFVLLRDTRNIYAKYTCTTYQSRERELSQQQLRRLLVLANLTQRHGSRLVPAFG